MLSFGDKSTKQNKTQIYFEMEEEEEEEKLAEVGASWEAASSNNTTG